MRRFILLPLWVLAALATSARAQTAGDPHRPAAGGRNLGGHTFVPSSTVVDPFIGTAFVSQTGGGLAIGLVDEILVDIGGVQDTLRPRGDLGFGLLGFAYQQHLGRRFAVRAALSAMARSGTSRNVIITEGISALSGMALGGAVQLVRGERHLVTASLDWRRNNLTELTPDEFAQFVGEFGLDSISSWKDHLIQDRRNQQFVGGMRGAYVVAPWLGLNGTVELGMLDQFEAGSDTYYNVGLMASAQLRQFIRVPVGVSLALAHANAPQRADDIFSAATTLGLGVYYTGREDFAVGLDMQKLRLSMVNSGEKLDGMMARIVVRYDF